MLEQKRDAPEKEKLTYEHKRILRLLLYYDIFDYPLLLDELNVNINNNQIPSGELQDLIDQRLIQHSEDYFGIHLTDDKIKRRKVGNQKAKELSNKVKRYSKLISSFPFVKGVYISGSLSKGYQSEDGDIDYFIITKSGKLWLARTLLIAYKKIILFNNRKYFCVNYFIDAAHLEIEEKNAFTATELITLLPMYTNGIHDSFVQSNQWVKSYYPNNNMKQAMQSEIKQGLLKKSLERLLNNGFGNLLDKGFMYLTLYVWKLKFGHFNHKEFDLALKTRRYVSKHHPNNFQDKVLHAFQQKIAEFESKHAVDLTL